ncbi:hypothetical protein BURKHO8Y_140580 [Burkholderia sp. 8Y]|nr:hypothetical protein BURKHO8Y_140580 [Burkholderia sp. 8Y]
MGVGYGVRLSRRSAAAGGERQKKCHAANVLHRRAPRSVMSAVRGRRGRGVHSIAAKRDGGSEKKPRARRGQSQPTIEDSHHADTGERVKELFDDTLQAIVSQCGFSECAGYFLVHRAFMANAAGVLTKMYSSSRYPLACRLSRVLSSSRPGKERYADASLRRTVFAVALAIESSQGYARGPFGASGGLNRGG